VHRHSTINLELNIIAD